MKTQNSRKFNKKSHLLTIVLVIIFAAFMGIGGVLFNASGAEQPALQADNLMADGNAKYARAKAEETERKAKLAIVIDDFGMDRRGVDEMLSVEAPLTIAVMPGLDFSTEDAERAHANGHEVILHMPMENSSYMPPEYYGPKVVRNNMTESEAVDLVKDCINSIPYAVGMNIHMGTGVSRNEKLITAIMNEMKSEGKYFLDSKTIEETVCPKCARETGVKFYLRDVFLEPSGTPNETLAYNYIIEAGEMAKKNGSAIAIGHVGPVGNDGTAKAIKKALKALKNQGVEVVALSEL